MDISPLWQAIKEACAFEYQAQRRQVLLLLPVFLAVGIGIYFALPVEPPFVLGSFLALLGLSIYAVLRVRLPLLSLVLFMICLGFFAGQVRTHMVYTPILQEDIGPVSVVGMIEEIEDLGDKAGARLILSDLVIEDLEQARTPRRARLKIWKDTDLRVGQRVSALAKLHPPSGPMIPGGFDFQRHLFFKGIGAVGFIFRQAEILEPARPSVFSQYVERARQAVMLAVEAHVPYPQAGVVMALMVGKKTAIAKDDQEAIRAAGLAHMLAISGLHVGLFSGVIFFVVRFLMVLVPGLALHYPVKKYATIFAILGALFYMFLAGSTIPTVRAVIMTAVVFLAIVLDRSPMSLRLVAFAAFLVLLVFPEALLSASFHLSFAAVTGLVVFYNWLSPYWVVWHSGAGFLRRFGLYFLAISMTTVVATVCTAPFALYHFHQLASYGLLGNVLAMPILAFLLMPFILLALLVQGLGLEALLPFVFWPAQQGAHMMLEVAHFVEGLEFSVVRTGVWPGLGLLFFVLGALSLIYFQRAFKLLSVVFFMVSIVLIVQFKHYDALVSSESGLVGVYRDNRLYVSDLRKGRFMRQVWTERFGLTPDDVVKWPKEGAVGDWLSCDALACRVDLGGRSLSYLRHESASLDECVFSDIVVAKFPLRGCRAAEKIDYYAARDGGVHGLRAQAGDILVDRSEDKRGKRLWSKGNLSL